MRRHLIWPVIILAIGAGCFGLKETTPTLRYVLDPELQVAVQESSGKSIALRRLESARPYKQNVVYRQNAEMGIYTAVEWSELPADAATRALLDALEATGRFTDVGNAVDLSSPDFILTGQLRRFDLVKDSEPWVAVCEIRLELRESIGRTHVWSKTLTTSEPLETPNHVALPKAMNVALGRLIEEAVTEIVAK